jgi:DNA invertase Pin-like site-specific DNA recombinase
MPSAYAYIRCSHEESAKSGGGLAAQEQTCLRQFEELSPSEPALWWGVNRFDHGRMGFFRDSVVSAFKRPLSQRPAGAALLAVLKARDVLFVSKVDRLFRNMRDMALTMQVLHRRRVRVRFGDIPLDTGTPLGELMLNVMVMMAQWESSMKAARAKETAAVRKALKEENNQRRAEKKAPLAIPQQYVPKEYVRTQSDPGILSTLPVTPEAGPPPAAGPGRIFLYVRCSHLDSLESGLGLEWQRRSCLAAAQRLREANPLLTIVEEPFVDEAVSAWKHRLVKRPSGKRLDTLLQPGDMVLFARLDRGFRSTRDMGDTLRDWQQRGVSVQFVAEALDLSTVWGRAVVEIMGKFAEIESELTSTRTKEALTELRKVGRGLTRLFGFKWAQANGVRSLVPDRREIALARLAHWCHRHCGLSLTATARVIERVVAKRSGRPEIPRQGITTEKARQIFPDDSWQKMVHQKTKRHIPLVRPHWSKDTTHEAVKRWPLIRDYLEKQRAAGNP